MVGPKFHQPIVIIFPQALPCSLAHIEANPDLKADHTRGVLVSRFDIMYEAFDNMLASGKLKLLTFVQ